MSSYFDGHIASIKPEIVEDIETVLEFAFDEHPSSDRTEAALRVKAYLEAYKANENSGDPDDDYFAK